MKTLIVEPSPSTASILAAILERNGMHPLVVTSGTEALRRVAAERPDLILLSLSPPDLPATRVAQHLRECEAPGDWIPIVLLADAAQQEMLGQALAAGGDDFLFKPINEVVLSAKLRAIQRLVQMRYSLLAMTRKLDAANQELLRLTAIDSLTGIANRRRFDETLPREWGRSMRQTTELSLLICDVDHFKRYNDRHGHPAGDACLTKVAATLTAAMERGGDLAARYGGEEFAVILPETGAEGACHVAESIRRRLADLKIAHPDSPFGTVTLSIGIATVVAMPETGPETLIRLADAALYQAKANGRNRVCLAEASGEDLAAFAALTSPID